jgi:hypothetical protein
MGEIGNTYKILLENLKGGNLLEDLRMKDNIKMELKILGW